MHFHCQLRAQKRRDQPMRDYLDGIQSICDSLASCSCHVDEIMQISTIIVGLPVKYEHVIIVISANRPPSDLQTVCCILLDAEGRQQNMLFSLPSDNVTYQPISSSLDQALQTPASSALNIRHRLLLLH